MINMYFLVGKKAQSIKKSRTTKMMKGKIQVEPPVKYFRYKNKMREDYAYHRRFNECPKLFLWQVIKLIYF